MTKNRPRSPDKHAPQRPTPEITTNQLDRFLDLQTHDLALRAQEHDLRLREIEHTAKLSGQSIQAQLQDRDAERKHRRSERHAWYYFVCFLFVALLGAMGSALYLGNEEFAYEVLKAVIYVVAAGTGGYFAGKQQGREQSKGGE